MHTVELYRKVRLACRDGMSERAAARHFGISRESVKKMLCFSVPPGYRRTAPVRRPKLDGFAKSLDSFDFKAIPALNKAQVLELARCEWIERRENVIALGPWRYGTPGTVSAGCPGRRDRRPDLAAGRDRTPGRRAPRTSDSATRHGRGRPGGRAASASTATAGHDAGSRALGMNAAHLAGPWVTHNSGKRRIPRPQQFSHSVVINSDGCGLVLGKRALQEPHAASELTTADRHVDTTVLRQETAFWVIPVGVCHFAMGRIVLDREASCEIVVARHYCLHFVFISCAI